MGGRPMPKPQASCTMTVADGMVVKTQHTSPVADKAQQGVMELLLINHPLDCPICDKGGECPLQNQAMSSGADRVAVRRDRSGRSPSRCRSPTRSCSTASAACSASAAPGSPSRSRATRSSSCSSAAPTSRSGPWSRLGRGGFQSYFSGNTIQICPVGALTTAPTGSEPARSTWSRRRASASTAPPGARPARDWRRGGVLRGWPATTRGQRGVDLRQGPLRLPLPDLAERVLRRWSAATTASSPRSPGPRRSSGPRRCCRPRDGSRPGAPATDGAEIEGDPNRASGCCPAAG